jgi:endonuclease YncB( thermonuclease family)
MSRSLFNFRNQGGVPFLILRGHFVVRANKQPDGDTLAFAASKEYKAGPVRTNVPVDTTATTDTNIRLQSIDAPEKSQPYGAASRDQLLGLFGFDIPDLGLSDTDFTAGGATQKRKGWLATHGMDGHKRPLGYIFAENPGFTHGQIVSAADVRGVLDQSANFALAANGGAFPAFYENTDETHAAIFQAAAEEAREAGKGVWEIDETTTGFIPTKAALGLGGTLVYPKFYRRVQKWKEATQSATAFIKWLKQQDDGKKLVEGAEAFPVPLWKIVEKVDAQTVAVPYDVSRLWFSE